LPLYTAKPILFNHNLRTNCYLNKHINGFLWGFIGGIKKKRSVISTCLLSYHKMIWGVYGGFKIPCLTRVILNLVKQSTIKELESYE